MRAGLHACSSAQATAPAPYAVLRNESAELAGVYPSDYMLLSRRREVNEKVRRLVGVGCRNRPGSRCLFAPGLLRC